MARKQKIPPRDHNEAEVLEIIKEVTDANIGLARQRKGINDQITANFSRIKALNVDMTAYKAAARRYEMDADVRHEFDRSITQVNTALGIPVQAEMDLGGGEGTGTGEIPDGA